MLMKQKYYKAIGETAFRLWIFASALEELEKNPKNLEKVGNLLDKVSKFAGGNWVKYNATEEEKRDLETIREKLLALYN